MSAPRQRICRVSLPLFVIACLCVLVAILGVANAQVNASYRPAARLLDGPTMNERSPVRLVAHGGKSAEEEKLPEYVPFFRYERRRMMLGGIASCFVVAGVARAGWFMSVDVIASMTEVLPPANGPVERNVNYGMFVAPALVCPAGAALMVWKVGKAFGRKGRLGSAMAGAYIGFGAGLLLPTLLSRRFIPEQHADRPLLSWLALAILIAPTSSAFFSMLEYKRSDKARFLKRIGSPSLAVTPAPGGGIAGVGFRF